MGLIVVDNNPKKSLHCAISSFGLIVGLRMKICREFLLNV